MWELDCEEGWEMKNWCFWTVVLEKTLESPLDCKEIQPVLKEINPGISLEGMILKLKLQYFGHLMRRVHWKRLWCCEGLGTTEDEMAGWHHGLDGCESEWTLGVGDGQRGLVCCDSWVCKELDTTEWLNWLTDWLKNKPLGFWARKCSLEKQTKNPNKTLTNQSHSTVKCSTRQTVLELTTHMQI